MKQQQFLNSHHSATFASPATPNNEEPGGQTLKGWSSERVPVSKYSSRNRHVNGSAVLFPFSSGRALPSKWDDAERWICSPVFGQEGSYISKSLQLIQSERRTKSKSGPLGPQMLGNYGNYSPLMPVAYGTGGGSTTVDSPFLGQSNNSSYGGRRRSCPGQSEQELACTREWLKMLNEPPDPDSPQEGDSKQDDDGVIEEGENQVTRALSRRDMGTQMLPSEGSSTTNSNCSSPPPAAGNDSPEMVKDVKVDKEDTFPIRRQSRPNRSPPSNDSDDDGAIDDSRLPISKLEREEAKIDEWENNQRAKAEAAIRKLEMKLERKRSKGTEKIMKKLKRAELKAEKMRTTVADNVSNASRNRIGGRTTNQRIGGLYRRIRLGCIANCVACACC